MIDKYTVIKFKSGLRAIHRRTASPVAHLSLTIGAGTRDELGELHGVAHLVEHLLFKGTENHRAYYINSALDSLGGELNAFTSKEETVLHATCPKKYAAKGAALLLDMAQHSLFAQGDLVKEKEVVIDEINSYKDSPSDLIFDEFEELLFAGDSLGRNILGDKRAVKKIKRDDLVCYAKEHYRTDKMIFAMSSSHSDGQFKILCEKLFGELSEPEAEFISKRKAPQRVELFDIERNKKLYQSHILLGGYAPSVYEEERLTAALLLNVVGGPSALSRMNMVLREKHALTYNAEGSYCPFSDIGLFTLYYSCEESREAKADKLLRGILDEFTQSEMTQAKLRSAKRQFIGQLLLSNENNESATISIAKSLLLFGECESLGDITRKIEAITPAQILSLAQKLFCSDNLYKLTYKGTS